MDLATMPACEATERALLGRLLDAPWLLDRPDVTAALFGGGNTRRWFGVFAAVGSAALDPVTAWRALQADGCEDAPLIVLALVDEGASEPWLWLLERLRRIACARTAWRFVADVDRGQNVADETARRAWLAEAAWRYLGEVDAWQ